MDLEEQVMGIIINAGQARSLCFEALRAAKEGNFAKAEALLTESTTFANQAHLVQTQLIEADQGEGKTPMTLIMVHAQDHLMTSMLAKELITELIELHREMYKNKQLSVA
ncbi:PTS N,N'-diacetylchitobiose transporter subunit IIA [Vibrio porteresiae]|uniref:PTS N,N'-diacetylchitobiose transporter subunit IIA n=1 Tax=Vibrio porteresiae DSM 19223 TaxID=1123496 RepID=A0ABZ0QIJ0_9VIBR|nr:PTS N,N'-diacetylchitobiose transporter subunit IIA [Vibrio porteresiae]WPC76270.1 PTS N,N'-diacetylchitobiose transporter subunit IIA [Vibrio porteresiae DSM 19223]